MNALLEGLQRREGLERIAKENDGGVAALAHGHALQRLQGQVFARVVGHKQFLEDDDLVVELAEADQEITVRRRGVDFVAEFSQSRPGGFEPFRGREGQQRGLVGRADEIEVVRPISSLSLSGAATGGASRVPAA